MTKSTTTVEEQLLGFDMDFAIFSNEADTVERESDPTERQKTARGHNLCEAEKKS